MTNISQNQFRPRNDLPNPDIAKLYRVKIINKEINSSFLFNKLDVELTLRQPPPVMDNSKMRLEFVVDVFENIIFVLQQNVTPGDKMRFVLQSPSLSYPISTNLLPADDSGLGSMICIEISKVLNSKEHFQLNGLLINVVHFYHDNM